MTGGLSTEGGYIRVSSNTATPALKLSGSTSGIATLNAPAVAGTTTITLPGVSGTLKNITTAPVGVGASKSITAAMSGAPILLDTAAGSTATLPAATGSGATYRFIVTATTTSNAHKILAASSSDYMNGIAIGFTGSTAKVFASAAATNHSIQMPYTGSQPSGGFIGDYFEIVDVAANLWNVSSMYQAGTTPTTPFSTATT